MKQYSDPGLLPSLIRSPLNEQAAVDFGADLLSEGFLLGVAIVLLVYEVEKGKVKEEAKAADLAGKFASLDAVIKQQQVQIEELRQFLEVLLRMTSQKQHQHDFKEQELIPSVVRVHQRGWRELLFGENQASPERSPTNAETPPTQPQPNQAKPQVPLQPNTPQPSQPQPNQPQPDRPQSQATTWPPSPHEIAR